MGVLTAAGISAAIAAYGAYQASEASKEAARTQSDASNRAMGLTTGQYNQSRNDLSQYRNLGWDASNYLRNMTMESGAANAPWTGTLDLPTYDYGGFTAPTQNDLAADPAYRLRQKEASDAIQHSAAARGTLLGGNTLSALQDRSQALASEEYGNTFNRALQGYQTNAQNAWNAYQSRYNKASGEYGAGQQAFYANQDRPFEKMTTLANLGYGAASAGAGVGQGYANNMSNLYTGQGNANAAGIIGSSNAWNQALYGTSNDLMTAYMKYKGY